jgi:hypothetical protein
MLLAAPIHDTTIHLPLENNQHGAHKMHKKRYCNGRNFRSVIYLCWPFFLNQLVVVSGYEYYEFAAMGGRVHPASPPQTDLETLVDVESRHKTSQEYRLRCKSIIEAYHEETGQQFRQFRHPGHIWIDHGHLHSINKYEFEILDIPKRSNILCLAKFPSRFAGEASEREKHMEHRGKRKSYYTPQCHD